MADSTPTIARAIAELLDFVTQHKDDRITGNLLAKFRDLQRCVARLVPAAGLQLSQLDVPLDRVVIGETRCPMSRVPLQTPLGAVHDFGKMAWFEWNGADRGPAYEFPAPEDESFASWLDSLRCLQDAALPERPAKYDSDEYVPAREIAERLGRKVEKTRGRLDRYRRRPEADSQVFRKIENRKPWEPRYLYRWGWAEAYLSEE